MTNKEIIITGVHMDLTDALKNLVHEKVEKLFKHEGHIIRIRMELAFNDKKGTPDKYTARGHIEINGPDINASETSDDLYKSIDQVVIKLDGHLRKRSKENISKRKHTHGIEIPADIPKTEIA